MSVVPSLCLIVVLELSVDGAAVFFFLERLALVVAVFASGQVDVELGPSVLVDEEQGGDDGESGILERLLQAVNLAAVEQQLAVAAGGVVVVGAVEVLGDVHVLHPNLAAKDGAVGVHEAGLAQADALDFRARQHHSCRVFLHQEVLELRFTVLNIDGFLLFFCHSLVVGESVGGWKVCTFCGKVFTFCLEGAHLPRDASGGRFVRHPPSWCFPLKNPQSLTFCYNRLTFNILQVRLW